MPDGSAPSRAEIESVVRRLRDDFPHFASKCLKLRNLAGHLVPFELNRSQLHIHEEIEDQKRRLGRVRKVIVKGRKSGASTYVEGRFYHRAWRTKNATQTFILTHEQPATDTIFGMAQTFHDNMPPLAKPAVKAANAKELIFADTGAGYRVSTAGSKETGRSSTFQSFHGSEVAFWPNAETHVAASLRTIGNIDDTEVILESTANGIGNVFHRYAMEALSGNSQFELIFIPWFWVDDYASPCRWKENESPGEKWETYGYQHGLSWEQLQWAYDTNREMSGAINGPRDEPCWLFRQEYPATVEEAFQSNANSFIPGGLVMQARKPREVILGTGPIILGIDPARTHDKVGIIDRSGRRAGERICERMDPGGSATYVAERIASILEQIRPDQVNIDTSEGAGAAIHDLLRDWGYDYVTAVSFGSQPIGRGPTGKEMYANRRAEMWDLMRVWLSGDTPVQLPDDDALHMDLTAPVWGAGATRYNPINSELVLEPKDKIKDRLGRSPDLGDALALTFAVPLAYFAKARNQPTERRRVNRRTGY